MKAFQALKTLTVTAVWLVASVHAQAALINRGGGLIYDTVLNITWLQDWNYAYTSGYAAANAGGTGSTEINAAGWMGWDAANTWAGNLVYGGFDDWRLPKVVDTGQPGCNLSNAGGTDCGYNVQTLSGSTVYSELAHLYYETLGNKAYCTPGDAACLAPQAGGWGLTNTGPFINMTPDFFWAGQQDPTFPGSYWRFYNFDGYQVTDNIPAYAVAVRDGDVPEPQTLALALLAAGAAVLARRRRPA